MTTAEPSNDELCEWASELYKDEDLEEECRDVLLKSSAIYRQSYFKQVYAKCKTYGRDGTTFDQYAITRIHSNLSLEWEMSSDPPMDPKEQLTVFHLACTMHDFVLVDAMIRLGADYQRLTGDGDTALSLACHVLCIQRQATRTTSPCQLRIIRRLLQLGVDANIGCPLRYACEANYLDLCQLLLSHGADPRIRGEDGKVPKELLAAPFRRRFTKLPRSEAPEPLCWCLTSGRLLTKCHGKEGGVEADPMYGCPCASGKLYGKCCKKRGLKFKETRDQFIQPTSILVGPDSTFPDLVAAAAQGESPPFQNDDPEEYKECMKSITQRILSSTHRSQFDPAFAYALENTVFVPKYWVDLVPKNERLVRQKEWNDAIDEYILSSRAEGDTRTPREIEECAKIGIDGASLYKNCSYCDEKEHREGEIGACSRCMKRVYCSKDCQKAHWKEGHKSKCGTELLLGDCCPIDLPSAATFGHMTNGMLKQAMQQQDG